MVRKNMTSNLATEHLQSDFNSKLLCDDKLNTLHGWFSLDSKYTENEIIKHIMEDE